MKAIPLALIAAPGLALNEPRFHFKRAKIASRSGHDLPRPHDRMLKDMSMLPIFYGKPFEDPYRHVDELSQVFKINHLQNVPADMMKMKLFPATLRDRAKDLFLKLMK